MAEHLLADARLDDLDRLLQDAGCAETFIAAAGARGLEPWLPIPEPWCDAFGPTTLYAGTPTGSASAKTSK